MQQPMPTELGYLVWTFENYWARRSLTFFNSCPKRAEKFRFQFQKSDFQLARRHDILLSMLSKDRAAHGYM